MPRGPIPVVQSVDEDVFASPLVRIGRFRRSTAHPSFGDSGPIRDDCFVFPRTSVEIRHSGDRFVADPNIATFYNRGQEYTRAAVSADGDRCEWFAVSRDVLRDAVRAHDPHRADHPSRPFRHTHTPIGADLYFAQRQVYEAVRRHDASVDGLAVEESVFALLDLALRAAYGRRPARQHPASHYDLVADTQGVLGRALDRSLTLQEIAADVGASVFHLCRTFRAVTGQTLHGYRTSLRIRAALERLPDERDLTAVALDFGFSSHSHFTAVFRRTFGLPPSVVRAELGAGQ